MKWTRGNRKTGMPAPHSRRVRRWREMAAHQGREVKVHGWFYYCGQAWYWCIVVFPDGKAERVR